MEGFRISQGSVYTYTAGLPVDCHGCHYRVVGFVENVVTNQELVLVRALDGPDRGRFFCCSLANFAMRYVLCDNGLSTGSTAEEPSPAPSCPLRRPNGTETQSVEPASLVTNQ